MSDAPDTIRILRETLELERAAIRRYTEHQSWAGDPRLCAYWEGLRRNEGDHHATILAELAKAGGDSEDAAPGEDPALGRLSPTTEPLLDAEPSTGAESSTGAEPAITPELAATPEPSVGHNAPLRDRGYAHILATLRSDLEFERMAVEKYATFAKQLGDPRLKALMREFVRAETGHGRGLTRTIERVSAPDYPVVLFCPTCAWQLDFGTDPADRATIHCPMCAMDFALRVRDGDFVLERI
jgi:rubrerythrin